MVFMKSFIWPIISDVLTSLLLPHLSSSLTDSLPSRQTQKIKQSQLAVFRNEAFKLSCRHTADHFPRQVKGINKTLRKKNYFCNSHVNVFCRFYCYDLEYYLHRKNIEGDLNFFFYLPYLSSIHEKALHRYVFGR